MLANAQALGWLLGEEDLARQVLDGASALAELRICRLPGAGRPCFGRPRRANCGFATPTSNSDSSTKAAAFAAGNCRGRPPVGLVDNAEALPTIPQEEQQQQPAA